MPLPPFLKSSNTINKIPLNSSFDARLYSVVDEDGIGYRIYNACIIMAVLNGIKFGQIRALQMRLHLRSSSGYATGNAGDEDQLESATHCKRRYLFEPDKSMRKNEPD